MRQEAALRRAVLEELVWHAAGFTALELRVWSLLARGDALGPDEIGDEIGAHAGSVGRALRRLRDYGFAEAPREQARDLKRKSFKPRRYVARMGPLRDAGRAGMEAS